MSTPLEEYALLSDLRTAALVSRDGSIDWLCLPRFDSPAMFTALLGGPDDGRWRLTVVDGEVVERRYLPLTFVLETTWRTPRGVARVTDFLPRSTEQGDLVRRVECLEGEVDVEHDLRLRFDYASATPWTREVTLDGGERALLSLAGPDAILVSGPILTCPDAEVGTATGGQRATRLEGRFALTAGEIAAWDLTWFPSHQDPPAPPDTEQALDATVGMWREWADQLSVDGPYRGGGRPVPAGVARTDEPRHRRHCGRPHHVASGGVRRRPQLGLPLHLAARRRVHHRGRGGARAHPGRDPLARLAPARGRR